MLDAILPPVCPLTGERVASPGLLSAQGWAALTFIDDPVCARCGAPFSADYGEGTECAACIAEPPRYASARAAVVYDDVSRRLIASFKYSDCTELAPLLAGWLARAGRSYLQPGVLLAPAPLHPRRLIGRRFNQAALLVAALARLTGLEATQDLLVRVRATPPQASLSLAARKRNVKGAFRVRDERAALVAGRRVVLVDDVLTTGATVSACAGALMRARAERVDVLVLARAMKEGVGVL